MHNNLSTGMNNVALSTVNNVVLHPLIVYSIVTALFNHQYCYNLLTRLCNNDNNNEQACSINIVFSCFNNLERPLLLHQC